MTQSAATSAAIAATIYGSTPKLFTKPKEKHTAGYLVGRLGQA
jgi:hypothetical protein